MNELQQRPAPAAGSLEYQMLIGGNWVDAADGEAFESLNPFSGEAWASIVAAPRTRSAQSRRRRTPSGTVPGGA